MTSLWQTHETPVAGCLACRLDRLTLWIWHATGEWRLCHRYEESAGPSGVALVAPPAGSAWVSFVGAGESERLRLVPAMPALPVIVRPAVPLNLLPGQHAAFFVGVPVSLGGDLLTANGAVRLAESPVQVLSKSWSGPPDDEVGMLCLALRSRARRAIAELDPAESGRAICALHIHNQSPEVFEFQRLTLLTDHLGLQLGTDGQLWTTPVEVAFRGPGSVARTRYLTDLPAAARQATQLTPPRQALAESLSSRVLNVWRSQD
jgi:hypothetical protein